VATNKDVFDRIADSWYGFRHWPLLRKELEELATRWSGGHVVNLGCGHGADFIPFSTGFRLTGLDFSRGMLRQGRAYMEKHGFEATLVQGDLVALPFRDGSFDHAVAVASYHHLDGDNARRRAFAELRRVLRPKGEAFLSVWRNPRGGAEAGPEDRLVPWMSGKTVLQRYYHFFTPEELGSILEDSGFTVLRLEPDVRPPGRGAAGCGNLCVLARRS
jgi:ubiquinone/menaquinone biosynthesis C-methylase UbiE